MVADVNQTRSCTTWNGSSEGFQEEFPKVKLIGWDASLQDSQEWKNLAFNWRNLFKWPWSVSGKGFHIPSIWAKTSAKFCSSSLFHVFHPQCVFLLFFSSLLPHKFPTGVLFSSIPGRVAKREAELRPLVIEQHYACGGWLLNGPSHLVARRDGAWTWSWLKTEGRPCWNTLKSLQTSGIFMNHGFLGDAKWFWLHKKLSSETNIR